MKNGKRGQPEELEELLHAIRKGSSGAFLRLSELYEPLLRASVSRYKDTLHPDDFEDLWQGASISLYRAALAYRSDRGVTFGLYAKFCVANGVTDTLRYLQKGTAESREKDPSDIQCSEEVENGEDPQDEALDRVRTRELHGRIRFVLSEMECRVFDLYLDGYSHAEIARLIGKEPKSVDNALGRARKKLSQIFDANNMPE